jgi:hypothetical protein
MPAATSKWQQANWFPFLYPIFPMDPINPQFKETAATCCPTCGRSFCLAAHSIDSTGMCSPSVVCPWGCGFHVGLRLLDWPKGRLEP